MSRRRDDEGIKIIVTNRKARHEYHIVQTWEAGLVLVGTEVKALRTGKASLGDAFGEIRDGEAWLCKMHIGPYEQGNRENHEPFRRRKLLLSRREIRKIRPRIEERGLTLVPLRVYFRNGLAKVELGLGRGKRYVDKRQDKAKQDVDRRMARELGRRRREGDG
ncbi:MAG: SsrA-binding protein SmpB [bacterium]